MKKILIITMICFSIIACKNQNSDATKEKITNKKPIETDKLEVVSVDKMNVVYKGLKNPLTLSIPGIPSNKLNASAPGLRRSGEGYIIKPMGKGVVSIKLSGTLPNGEKVRSIKKFIIKDIPSGSGSIRGKYGTVSLPKSSVSNVTINAGVPNFLFDLKLIVTGFTIKGPGITPVKVAGKRMNMQAKKAISKVKAGDHITVYDIKALVSGNGYRLKEVLPITILIEK